jgi:ATP-dependent protease ClpP protease subunit
MEDFKILEGEFGEQITLSSIQGNNKFKLNSPGGDLNVGYLLHDEFKTNNSEVGVVGLCASAGTIALLGTENRWGSKNSEYLIHYPMTGIEGTAEVILKRGNELQSAQDKLVEFYIQNLKIGEQEIRQLMKSEATIDSEKALEIGLINEIRSDDLAPLQGNTIKEKFYNLKIEKMSKETLSKEDFDKGIGMIDKVLNSIKNLLPKKIQNLVLKDTNGTELDFDVESEGEIVVGTKVTAPDGDYIMEDGTVYVIASNEVIEIKEPEEDEMAKKERR